MKVLTLNGKIKAKMALLGGPSETLLSLVHIPFTSANLLYVEKAVKRKSKSNTVHIVILYH